MAKSLHQLSSRSQTIVFVALCGLTTVGTWQVLIGPEHAQLASERARLATVQGDVARASATAARLPQLQREVQNYETRLAQTTAVLPDEKDPADVLNNLHEVASESALDLSSWSPKPIVTKAQYSEWPITLGLEGNYHDLGRFFDRIASMPRLMSVSDLQIKTQIKPNVRTTVTASCVATTFVFRKDLAPEVSGGKQ
jgi:type IV pilus assembly protein PilO